MAFKVWQRHSTRQAARADCDALKKAGWKTKIIGRQTKSGKNWYDVYRSK